MSNELSKELANNGGVGAGGRLVSGAIVAALVVGILFWAMQYMIKIGAKAETDDISFKMPDFVRAKVIENEVNRRKPPKKPPPPDKPPKQPPPPKLENVNAQADAISVSAAPVNTEVSLSDSGFSVGNIGEGEYLPIVKIAPIYPPRAADRGVTGHCTVIYSVTTNGSTANIRIDENDCTSSLFHRASLKAAEKFKYKPTVRNGEAIEVPNVKNRFTYELED